MRKIRAALWLRVGLAVGGALAWMILGSVRRRMLEQARAGDPFALDLGVSAGVGQLQAFAFVLACGIFLADCAATVLLIRGLGSLSSLSAAGLPTTRVEISRFAAIAAWICSALAFLGVMGLAPSGFDVQWRDVTPWVAGLAMVLGLGGWLALASGLAEISDWIGAQDQSERARVMLWLSLLQGAALFAMFAFPDDMHPAVFGLGVVIPAVLAIAVVTLASNLFRDLAQVLVAGANPRA